jgi:hypothetical protein
MNLRLMPTVLALLGCVACGSPDKHAESPFAPAPDPNAGPPNGVLPVKPWTDKFIKSAVLVAQDVRVEGPDGLLEHFVAVQELDIVDVQTKTTSDGLLQTYTLKNGQQSGEIRAQLDNLNITCMRHLEVLERPGHVPVVVQAKGEVFYQETGSTSPTRGPTLRLEGVVAR